MEQGLRRGERIELRGFGAFRVGSYEAYEGRKPRTAEAIHVAPRRTPASTTRSRRSRPAAQPWRAGVSSATTIALVRSCSKSICLPVRPSLHQAGWWMGPRPTPDRRTDTPPRPAAHCLLLRKQRSGLTRRRNLSPNHIRDVRKVGHNRNLCSTGHAPVNAAQLNLWMEPWQLGIGTNPIVAP